MTDKLNQIIKDEIARLPREGQDVINSLDWIKIAEEVGKKYLLNESEMNDFQVETLLIILGLEDGGFYASNIEKNVGTSRQESEKMVDEVSKKILAPMYKKLIENIKKGLPNKNPNYEQSVDFILSGGDYTAFLESGDDTIRNTQSQ